MRDLSKARAARAEAAKARPSVHCAFGHALSTGWYGWQHAPSGYATCPQRAVAFSEGDTLPLED